MQTELPISHPAPTCYQVKEKGAYFTPVWAGEMLWDQYMAPRAPRLVCEPSCGSGNMLLAVPTSIPAYGIEIQASLAELAGKRTRRKVFCGSFLEAPIDPDTDCFFGNPPFSLPLFEPLLHRIASLCRPGTRCGVIAPAYFFRTPASVLRLNEKWTIEQDALPATLFNRISHPLVFAQFTLEPKPSLVNFALYQESDLVSHLPRWLRQTLEDSKALAADRKGGWARAVEAVLSHLGGEASLSEIYSIFESPQARPSAANSNWKEKIRQTLQLGPFLNLERGKWALATDPCLNAS